VAFAHGTSDHQSPHLQETRPHAANRLNNCPCREIGTGEEILIDYEERLNSLNVAIPVPDSKVSVVEALSDCVFDQLIEAMVLALAGESAAPVAAVHQLCT
jgi:hypothetical protein